MKKLLLVEPSIHSRAYNIALMKFARFCEENDIEYQYVRGLVKPEIEPELILMSCVFTYYSKKVEKTINYYLDMFPESSMLIGGVFPSLQPKWFDKPEWKDRVKIHRYTYSLIENLVPKWNVKVLDEDIFKTESMQKKAEAKYDNIVMYASRGCVNKCGYCAVPRLEGCMNSFKSIKNYLETSKKELPNAKSVVLYDNNFTEHKYFDNIVDELKDNGLPVDIHGLHVDSFTQEKANKMAELTFGSQGKKSSTAYLRFSFDKLEYKDNIKRALQYTKNADIKASFFCYVLYNFTDTPFDFWKRIVYTQEIVDEVGLGIWLFPQRYEPFAALEKNKFLGKHWSKEQVDGLKRMVTFLHGFMAVNNTHNLFNWIGYDFDEFNQRIIHMGKSNKNKLVKKSGTPPTLEELLKTIEVVK